jgi:PrgI family protein
MQYKIPIQIENEDVIVAWLSLRQLMIMMIWWGIGYGIFKFCEPRIGAFAGIWLGAPFAIIGVVVALLKISEMTFLPATLNFFRLSLNAKSRIWSQGADSYSEMEIGYILPNNPEKVVNANKTYDSVSGDEFSDRMGKL